MPVLRLTWRPTRKARWNRKDSGCFAVSAGYSKDMLDAISILVQIEMALHVH